MLNFLRHPRGLTCLCNFLELKNTRFLNTLRPCTLFLNYSSKNRLSPEPQQGILLKRNDLFLLTRSKYKGKKSTYSQHDEESSDEEEEEEDDDIYEGDIVTLKLKSLRVDALLKSACKISKKKVEHAFYQNKILVNGERLKKKSHNVREGDEIHFTKPSASELKSAFLHQIKIVKIKQDVEAENIIVKITNTKSKVVVTDEDSVQ